MYIYIERERYSYRHSVHDTICACASFMRPAETSQGTNTHEVHDRPQTHLHVCITDITDATDATQALKVLRIKHASNMLNMHKATLPSKSDMHKASEMPWRNAIKACRPRIHCRWYVGIIERNHLRGNCVTCYSLKCNVQTRKLQDDPEKFLQNVDGFHACNKRPKPIVSPWLASSPVRTLKCGKHLQAAPEYFIVNSYIYITYYLMYTLVQENLHALQAEQQIGKIYKYSMWKLYAM